MTWTDFAPGKRVVSLIDWRAHLSNLPMLQAVTLPKIGEICTVHSQQVGSVKGNLVLFLEEHPPVLVVYREDGRKKKAVLGFEASYFKPLDESRIDVFRALLNTAPADEAVPA